MYKRSCKISRTYPIVQTVIKFLLCLPFLWIASPAFAQAFPEKKISVQAIGINQGLSQGMINCILQDHFGFMWFGTLDGLNRYNGNGFQIFRNNSSDSTCISGNFITSIFEDSKKRLWIGTALNGLNLFVPEKEQFIHFTTGTQPALSNNTVFSIQEDRFGNIWIGTQSGLNKLTMPDKAYKKNKSFYSASHANNLASVISIKHLQLNGEDGKELFTSSTFEPHFLITKGGTIWVSTPQRLFKILPVQGGSEIISKEDSLLHSPVKPSTIYRYIFKIIEDTTNELLCFKGINFITILHEKTGKTSRWNCEPLDMSTGRNQVVVDHGILWERTAEGLFCFDLLHKKIYRMRSYQTELDKIINMPFSIYKDRSDIIWIGSGGYGLLKYNPRTEYFHTTITKSISWMSATPSGNVLLMTPEIQYLVKDTSGNYTHYTTDEAIPKKIVNLTKQTPDIALQDKEGNYWLNINGIIKVNLDTKTIQHFKKTDGLLFPYFLDKQDRLWYATQQYLSFFDKITNTATSYNFPVTPVAASPYKFCQVIYQDAKGIFWLGTTEGLFSFNEVTRLWRHYKNKPGDPTSLSTNIIFSICDDPQAPGEYLWIGTNGGGLNRLHTNSGRFEHISLEEGLPDMVVYGILTDGKKQLWMSTNKGITCLQPQYSNHTSGNPGKITGNKFRYFYEENGLQSNEFNRSAACKTSDGIFFFGGVNGLNYFNPDQITGNTIIPGVVITAFKINNKPVSFTTQHANDDKGGKSPLSKPVFLTDTIELAYTDNMITFEFASLDYTAPEKNLYQYKMDGFEKKWIQSGNSHSATYTNLDPGKYTFIVKGSNSEGVWNDKGASVYLIIHAPWYMTWWFRAASLIAVAVLLYFSFRYRLQQKIKLFNMRNNIASDLHDEIGSTLSSVYIYSEVAQQTPETASPQKDTYLKQISADTGNMISALSDIVWTVNAKNDRFENIINRMRAAAVELFEAKGYQLHLQFTEQLHTSKLDMASRKNFYLFYKEAINNAAKYACGKNVWITLGYNKPLISLFVKDDGKGFIPDDKHPGNGLANMQKRAVELKGTFKLLSSSGAGTEVHLCFPV